MAPPPQRLIYRPPPPTHFLWWCAAILCSLLSIAVIIAGIVIFVGYVVIHPRVPVISVVDAHLFHFNYDGAGVLVTQINIVVRSQNDNMKAHAGFSNFNLELFFDGIRIAVLSTAAPYEVKKNSSVDFNYDYTSDPIPLSPEQMEDVDAFLKEDEVRFDLKGGVRARWRVGVLGSVGFFCSLNCQLRFHPANGTYISRRCSSRAK
ncbi:LATE EMBRYOGENESIS ABUNDANT (LEA) HYDROXYPROLINE-RICH GLYCOPROTEIN FAMILY [Salix viminalis]|uniref:LATE EMBRYOGENESIS ABUNDANT (LEA) HYDROXYPROLINE-RICH GLYCOPROTEIN FAMILY n=1 Tax=Salix viminalis TaxID=40686 RepID=A0A9Q0QD55_SALVM|nr:LATE EMBRYOGENESIS ABUNDANT (LEA) HYDROXYPROLINE-RICH GLYCOPROTEIN FAMILY [Salix viminalis]